MRTSPRLPDSGLSICGAQTLEEACWTSDPTSADKFPTLPRGDSVTSNQGWSQMQLLIPLSS